MNVFPSQIKAVDTRLFHQDEENQDPSLLDQMGAAFQLDSPEVAGGRLIRQARLEPEADPDFNLFDHLTPDEALHAEEYTHADSKEELVQIRQRRQHEAEWHRELGEGPLNPIVASTLAILGSPSTYVTFGVGALAKAGTIAARARRVGAVTAAEVGASEALLQASQETRGWEETAAAVLMGGAFGYGLGAAGAKMADNAYNSAVDDAVTLLRAEGAPADSAGAARVQTYHPSDTELAPSMGVAAAISSLPKFLQAPSLSLMRSSSALVRESALRLVDVGMITKGTLKGVAMPQAVDIAIRSRQQELSFTLSKGAREAFATYRQKGGKLGKQEFYEEIGKAMRRGGKVADPVIAKAADDIRTGIFDKLAAEAKARVPDFKMLPEKDGWRYLTRVYRRDKIAAELPQWHRVIADHFMASKQAIDQGDALEMAEGVTNAIMGMPTGRTNLVMAPPSLRGPTKERVFDIPDELIEPWLESNVLEVGGRYIRTLAADIEFARLFPDVGNPMDPIKDWAPKIRDEAMAAAEAAEPGKRKAILDQADVEIETLSELVNRVRGIEPPPLKGIHGAKQVLKIARDVSAMRSLGSIVASSLNDVGRIQMMEGFTRVYGTLLGDMVTGFKAIRMGVREAQRIGDAVDLEFNSRAQALFDVDATNLGQTWLDKVSRGSGRMTTGFMKATGMPHWNTFWKGVASTVASTRLLRTAERLAAGKEISKFDRMRMAQSGLSEADMRAIAKQAEHWQQVGSNRLANINDWTDPEAARKFRNALVRDIDDAIITPGAGDAPLWTGTDLGKTVFQFKRFGMASTQRTLISGLQRRDAATMGAVVSMLGLGATSALLKDIVNHGELKDRNIRNLVGDAIDRSGLLALYLELEALFPMAIRPSSHLFDRPLTRFAGRSPVQQLAGPTAGWFDDAFKAANGLVTGDFTQPDLHKARRLVPFQNHFMLSAWLTHLEEVSGLPEKQR